MNTAHNYSRAAAGLMWAHRIRCGGTKSVIKKINPMQPYIFIVQASPNPTSLFWVKAMMT